MRLSGTRLESFTAKLVTNLSAGNRVLLESEVIAGVELILSTVLIIPGWMASELVVWSLIVVGFAVTLAADSLTTEGEVGALLVVTVSTDSESDDELFLLTLPESLGSAPELVTTPELSTTIPLEDGSEEDSRAAEVVGASLVARFEGSFDSEFVFELPPLKPGSAVAVEGEGSPIVVMTVLRASLSGTKFESLTTVKPGKDISSAGTVALEAEAGGET